MQDSKKTIRKTQNFDHLNLRLASPDEIQSWSFGEVTKSETINYRTQRSERDGLFCEKIFGPEHDFQCSCGKYKGNQYQGITCSNCGVEVTRALVRRERMGHIELATPVAHPWYLRKVPSRVAMLLGLPAQQVQNVVYYSSYYVLDVDEGDRKKLHKSIKKEFDEKLQKAGQEETREMLNILYETRVNDLDSVQPGIIIDGVRHDQLKRSFPDLFKAEKGGEVIYNLLKDIDLEKKEREVLRDLETANKGQQERLQRQLLIIRSFIQSGNRPEWMFVTVLPVIPPGIRPIVQLDGGRYASSDLNDLYRHIIVRNNRLKEFRESKAPAIFVNTQKRLLQESVDALFEKSTGRGAPSTGGRGQSRQLKPISEYLGGKTGYFRLNLLGKRVDFVGRSVIVVGQHLKLDEFGLPKTMALEIFKPFIIGEIFDRDLAFNIRGAQRLIDSREPVVWEILEKVIVGKYMLLNRAPTLHRQSIQAFRPILTEGLAIEFHPLVCTPYNADFDGDAVVVHLPLSEEAQAEAKNILASSMNVVSPASGEINITPAEQDIVLGCYWATEIEEGGHGEGKYFANINEAISASDYGIVGIRSKIKVLASDKEKYGEHRGTMFETTVGRLLFNMTLPKEYPYINDAIDKKMLKQVTRDIFDTLGRQVLVDHLDLIKDFGFKYAMASGVTFSWEDLRCPGNRDSIIQEGFKKSQEVMDAYNEGTISLQERKRKNIDLWLDVKGDLSQRARDEVLTDSPVGKMIQSGARGSFDDLGDMTAMFGVVDSASGEPIEQPVISSLKDGMKSIEYFNASFGARKGAADTALKTADAGFLSRKLFSVAQEIRIDGDDCGTTKGFNLYRETESGAGDSFSDRIRGRFLSEDVVGDKGKAVAKKGDFIDRDLARTIEKHESVDKIRVRSPITCLHARGVCAKCYGEDRTTGEIVDLGEAVGTIAAQSVGEPGTQLTLRTFHAGGVAQAGGDITSGLPRVTELFERRAPKVPAVIAHADGTIEQIEEHSDGSRTIYLNVGAKRVAAADKSYSVSPIRTLSVAVGDEVTKGQFLTDGSADLEEMLQYCGKEATQEYILSEVSKVYELQGVGTASIHFEIIIRQMFSRLRITDSGDGIYTAGEVIDLSEFIEANEELKTAKKHVMEAEHIVTGITNVSVSRSNFLSSASFQNTTSVLIRAAISGSKDTLDGVKENVIIGRLVPVGSGFEGSKKHDIVRKISEDVQRRLEEAEAEKEAE
ncbi:MAG: DNA-directed RNA polymerase subunit beta' [Candidatus Kaiserbacteria bacterium]|nr:DNA-directed RNA polymerase subunit beta' [Candidatus Kaiserbacteria bacterium]